MAGVRKSSHIKVRKTSYMEDDFEYDFYDFDLGISTGAATGPQQSKRSVGTKAKSKSTSTPDSEGKKEKKNKSFSDSRVVCNKKAKGLMLEGTNSSTPPEQAETSPDHQRETTALLGTKSLSSPLCGQQVLGEGNLEAHMEEHGRKDGRLNGCYVCDICHKVSVDSASYNRHMRTHMNDRPFKCDLCDKTFTESCSLKRHQKSHQEERPYVCDVCFKSFRDSTSFVRHQKTHSEQPRMYQCLKCDKTFTEKHGLKRHERTHTGFRPFECNVCGKRFSEIGSFRRHQKIHSGVRNFHCWRCKRSFLEKQSLMRHMRNVCGFGGYVDGSERLFSDYNQDTFKSDMDLAEISQVGFDNSPTQVQKPMRYERDQNDVSGNEESVVKSEPSVMNAPGTTVPQENDGPSASRIDKMVKHSPSLGSLMKKDPNLYDSISEIVESIDSYEKMLDLCGDTGQKELDAALTRESPPMPDNLLCFECGELLVDGENFKKEGKNFTSASNSFKCLSCDEDNEFGDPPVLTAEVSTPELIAEVSVRDGTHPRGGVEHGVQGGEGAGEKVSKGDVLSESDKDGGGVNVFGSNESLEHLRERLHRQHGVYFVGDAYRDRYNYKEGDSYSSDASGTRTASSRSDSTDSDRSRKVVPYLTQSLRKNEHSQQKLSTAGSSGDANLRHSAGGDDYNEEHQPEASSSVDTCLASVDSIYTSQVTQQGIWSSVPRLEYEADDPSIPSVFPCHLCTKVFATSSFLSQHLELHKKSPHKCMVCGKSFTNAPSLKRHMLTHTGEKPYACPKCNKQYRDPSNFCKHKKNCTVNNAVVGSLPAPGLSSVASATSRRLAPTLSYPDSEVEHHNSFSNIRNDDLIPISQIKDTLDKAVNYLPLKLSYDSRDDEDDSNLTVSFLSNAGAERLEGNDRTDLNGFSAFNENQVSRQNIEKISEEKMKSEAKDMDDSRTVMCELCERTFQDVASLDMHMNYHNGDPNVTCVECGKSFADPHGLKRHVRIHAGIRPYICEYCCRGYCDAWSLKKHKSRGCLVVELQVPADLLYPCPQCTRVFGEQDLLLDHMKTHKGLLKYECDICSKKFSEAFNLKRHRRLHMAVCPGCDREFRDAQSLHQHQESDCIANTDAAQLKSKEDGFPCLECGRVYSTKAYLERHKKFHSELKPHVCEICNKKFAEAFRLRRHMKVHTNIPHAKFGNSKKAFYAQNALDNGGELVGWRHKEKHQGEEHGSIDVKETQADETQQSEFPCSLCNKVFQKNYLLVRHMNVHSQERPFSCDTCGRSYKDTSSLRRHQLVHQGVKDHICFVCGKDFYYSDSLRRHMNGRCGKKSKKRKRKQKSGKAKRVPRNINKTNNNNIDDVINNNALQELSSPTVKPRKLLTAAYTSRKLESSTATPINSFSSRHPLRFVPVGHWSCHKKRHCWLCDLKLSSRRQLIQHARSHKRRKRYGCTSCFLRFPRKAYWKAHMSQHSCRDGAPTLKPLQPTSPPVIEGVSRRPKRSIPRAQWSWISQI